MVCVNGGLLMAYLEGSCEDWRIELNEGVILADLGSFWKMGGFILVVSLLKQSRLNELIGSK